MYKKILIIFMLIGVLVLSGCSSFSKTTEEESEIIPESNIILKLQDEEIPAGQETYLEISAVNIKDTTINGEFRFEVIQDGDIFNILYEGQNNFILNYKGEDTGTKKAIISSKEIISPIATAEIKVSFWDKLTDQSAGEDSITITAIRS